MRYIYIFLFIVIISMLSGCENQPQDMIEVSDDHYFIQIDDIKLNYDSYKNKTIKITGMYGFFQDLSGNLCGPAIYRIGPGCCNNDSLGYLLTSFSGDSPSLNHWIEITGSLDIDPESGEIMIYVNNFIIIDEDGYKRLYENL